MPFTEVCIYQVKPQKEAEFEAKEGLPPPPLT